MLPAVTCCLQWHAACSDMLPIAKLHLLHLQGALAPGDDWGPSAQVSELIEGISHSNLHIPLPGHIIMQNAFEFSFKSPHCLSQCQHCLKVQSVFWDSRQSHNYDFMQNQKGNFCTSQHTMAQNIHSHPKREELGHIEEILDHSRTKTHQRILFLSHVFYFFIHGFQDHRLGKRVKRRTGKWSQPQHSSCDVLLTIFLDNETEGDCCLNH